MEQIDKNNDIIILFRKNGERFKDCTNDIISYTENNNSYYVTFFNSSYHVSFKNISILNYAKDLEISEKIIYYNNLLKSYILRIKVYKNESNLRLKLLCKNGFELVCLENEISYVKFSNADKTLLEYWKDCANETNDFTIKNLLNDQYEKIKFFNEDSVLYSYVNQITEKHELENEIICPFNFNKTQIDAIRNCLTNQISIINGPPGTGKTNTILNIISNLIIRGKSVAVVSATNSAISNIEQKLDKKNYKSIYASLGNEENKAKFFNKNKIDEKFLSTDNNKLNKQLLNKLSILFNLDNNRSIKAELLNCLRLEKEYYEKFSNCNTNTEESKNFRFKSAESLIKYVTRYQHDTQNKKFTFFL